MKKFVLFFLIVLFGCHDIEVKNSIGGDNKEVFVQVGAKKFKVNKVIISTGGSYIYVLAPQDTVVKVWTQEIGYKQGKVETTVVTVE